MKKGLCLFFALVMVMSMVACSGTGSSTGSSDSTAAGGVSQSTETVAGSDKEVTIKYWYQNASFEKWITKMAEDFHAANPNITVVPEIYGDDNALTAALTAAIQGKTAPAIFHTRSNASFATYAGSGALEELSGYSFASRLNDAAITAATYDDGLYAACLGYSAFCVIYNKDIFDKLGLTAPKSFDEMVAVVKACKDAGYGGIAYPGSTANHVWLSRGMLHTTMTTNGYKAFEEGIDKGTVVDISAETKAMEALRSIAGYYENGLFYNGSDSMDTEAMMTLFSTGKAAMMVTFTGNMVTQEALSNMNLGIFPLQSKTGNGSYYTEVTNMISMYSGASGDEKAAAAKFIEFLLNDENMTYYATQQASATGVDGIIASHKYGDLFDSEFSSRGVTMRSLCIDQNTEMWKPELDSMLLGILFSGKDVDKEVSALTEHLKKADIKSLN